MRLKHLNLWSYPDGPVPSDSHFYIERPPLERKVYREVTTSGCVIRIKSSKQMGKSSLVLRLCAFAQKQGYQTVNLNCYQFDSECLTDLNKLLRRLCWKIATQLGIDPLDWQRLLLKFWQQSKIFLLTLLTLTSLKVWD